MKIAKKCFFPGSNQDNDKRMSVEITQQLQRDFDNVFTGMGALMGHFHYWLNQIANYLRQLWEILAYSLQKPLKEEL